MTKDNSTGKDKEFYDLGKKMFDHIQVIKARAEPKMKTEEDEAFEEIERAQQQKVEDSVRRAAQESALHFISDIDSIELGMMTLRKAYEIGYRAGMYTEQRKKDAV
jgi:DNA polymerase III delta prime subunit